MKKMITLALLLSLFFCIEVRAQQPGDSKILASNASMKGKRELRKEKRVEHRKKHLLKKNVRHAVSRSKDKYTMHFGAKSKRKKKKHHEKERSATSGEKPKE